MTRKNTGTEKQTPVNKTKPAPDFEKIKHQTPAGIEYWSARELAPLLGYKTWREFETNVLPKAMLACRNGGNEVGNHFVSGYKMVGLGSSSKRRVKDYILSRFACYLVAQNGNSRLPEIATAMTYFAVAARENELQKIAELEARRIELRQRVDEGEQDLEKTAQRVGVLPENFGIFHNAGYSGLYGGLNIEAIKERKGINEAENLHDRSGITELAANALRIALTEELLSTNLSLGEEKATQTHHNVGTKIRETIGKLGTTMPEDLPAEPSIKPMLDEKKKKSSEQPKI